MQHQLIKMAILAGGMFALSCNSQAANRVAVVPLFSATGNATAADVMAGKTFSSSLGKGLTGTLVPPDAATGNATAADVLAGQTFSNSTDNNLIGVRSPAPVVATGQTATDPIVAPTGADGDLAKGVSVATRFTDNGNGTVTDNLTGLVWLQDANCTASLGDKVKWDAARLDSNALANGDCGLNDGSSPGDWRLPNLFELESLRDMSENAPALNSGHPFTGVIEGGGDSYWTSTTVDDTVNHAGKAWIVEFTYGLVQFTAKDAVTQYYTWPVRDAN